MVDDAKIVDRVNIASDQLGRCAHARPADRVARKQRGQRMAFFQIFDDRQRLGQHRAVIELQGRHDGIRIDLPIGFGPLLAANEVHGFVGIGLVLEVEGDPDAPGGGTAPIAEELHASLRSFGWMASQSGCGGAGRIVPAHSPKPMR